jgi:hypothetical protein
MSENSICVYEIVGEDNCPPYSEDRFYAFPCDGEGACAEEVRIPANETCPHDTVFVLVQNRCDWDRSESTAERDASPRSPAMWARGDAAPARGELSGDELAVALGSANAALDGLADGSATDDAVLLDALEVLASQDADYAPWRAGQLLGRWHRVAEERRLREAVQRARLAADRLGGPGASAFAAESRLTSRARTTLPLSGMRTLTAEQQRALKPLSE